MKTALKIITVVIGAIALIALLSEAATIKGQLCLTLIAALVLLGCDKALRALGAYTKEDDNI